MGFRSGASVARTWVACGVLLAGVANAESDDDVVFRDGFECVVLPLAHAGCEFYAVPLANTLLSKSFAYAVSMANGTNRPARVVVSGSALVSPVTVMVTPQSVSWVALPWVNALQTTAASVLVTGAAYRIVSDGPLTVQQFNPLQYTQGGQSSYTNDASLLLPVHALSGHYRVVAWPSWQTQPGLLSVVGTENGTIVEIASTANLVAGAGLSTSAGATSMVSLNRGDVLQVLAQTPGSVTYANDLSGSVVTANAPVAVFGGHDASFIPATSGYADHLEEQLPPAETLGTDFIVAVPRHPIGASKHFVKLVGVQDGTTLVYTPAQPGAPASLDAGDVFDLEATTDFRMISTQPLIVAQYLEGGSRFPGSYGDPAMGIVVPSAQFRPQYTFATPSYDHTWVTIVAPEGEVVTLDGTAVDPMSFATIAGTPYAVARVLLSATDLHRISASVPIGVYVYGYAQDTSYLLPAGMGLVR